MRSILTSLISIVFLDAAAFGQAQPPRDVIRDLSSQGIDLRPVGDGGEIEGWIAHVIFREGTTKALDLLRTQKDIVGVSLWNGEGKETDDALDRLAKLPIRLKYLQLRGGRITESHLKKIAALKQVENLALEDLEVTDAQIRQLHVLKNLKDLKMLHLVYSRVSTKALEELKRELPQVKKFYYVRDKALRPVTIATTEAPLVKLQKQKYNAAVAAFNWEIQPRLVLCQ